MTCDYVSRIQTIPDNLKKQCSHFTSSSSMIPFLKSIFQKSDVISIHIPSLSSTRGLIGQELIESMKTGAILINTSRGEIVDQTALKRRLMKKEIRAGLDVLLGEPKVDEKLIELDNVVITPHIGGSTIEAVETNARMIIDRLTHFSQEND